eukprot:1830621-Rhodomonas_salina.1
MSCGSEETCGGGAMCLLRLPPSLFSLAWPAERGVLGMRVCRQLRSLLASHASGVLFVKRRG